MFGFVTKLNHKQQKMKHIYQIIVIGLLSYSCTQNSNENKVENQINKDSIFTVESAQNTLTEKAIFKKQYSSIDSILLKRTTQKIIDKLQDKERLLMISEYNHLDINYDGYDDLLIGIQSVGLNFGIACYLFNPKTNNYNTNVYEEFGRATFHLDEKKICDYTPYPGGGEGTEYRWIKNNWVKVKEVKQSFINEDSCKWYINYLLENKTDTIITKLEFEPSKNILDLGQN